MNIRHDSDNLGRAMSLSMAASWYHIARIDGLEGAPVIVTPPDKPIRGMEKASKMLSAMRATGGTYALVSIATPEIVRDRQDALLRAQYEEECG